jgi:GTP cyclohydrolase I
MSYKNDFTHSSNDPELGTKVFNALYEKKLDSLRNEANIDWAKGVFFYGIRDGLTNLGLDIQDPSIKDTPKRFANMFVDELCWGLNYDNFPKCTTTPNDMSYDQMVLVRGIQTTSLCEHHLQTIDGVTHIAYIPKDKVMGLSKFARVTNFFARRPQIQERMTEQIHAALCYILDTDDIAVVVNAVHYCMKARGVEQQNCSTQTDKCSGRFLSQAPLRQEFLHAIRG